jgi:hypothetical protein
MTTIPRRILGKTITGVIVCEENQAGPRQQIFLLFDDDTAYEIYGNDVHGAGGLDQRNAAAALTYARSFQGRVQLITER